MIRTTEDINSKFLDYLRKKGIMEGMKLPPERVLAEILETSRPTLRKVLEFYEKRKMIGRSGRNGTVVKKLPESDYMPFSGRNGSSKVISVAMPDFTHRKYETKNFWKYAFIQDCIMSRGYVLNVYYSGLDAQSPEKEKKYLESLFSIKPNGLIIIATCLAPTNEALFAELNDSGVKVVHIDRFRDELPSESFMMPDLSLTGALAVSYLRNHGCRKLNLHTPTITSPSYRILKDGVLEGCESAGIEYVGKQPPCTGTEFEKRLLDDYCRQVEDDEGLIVHSYYGLKFFAEVLERLKRPHVGKKRIIGIDTYDADVAEKPQKPIFTFSWKERFADAVDYIVSGNKNQVHKLYKPVFMSS